jgi:cell division protein ZapA
MTNLTLTIGGRPFTVSCADGEEDHISMLGRMIDERASRMGSGQTEPRMLLFSALMLADELHEAHRHAPVPTPAIPVANTEIDGEIVDRVNSLAERIESLAATLEQAP